MALSEVSGKARLKLSTSGTPPLVGPAAKVPGLAVRQGLAHILSMMLGMRGRDKAPMSKKNIAGHAGTPTPGSRGRADARARRAQTPTALLSDGHLVGR